MDMIVGKFALQSSVSNGHWRKASRVKLALCDVIGLTIFAFIICWDLRRIAFVFPEGFKTLGYQWIVWQSVVCCRAYSSNQFTRTIQSHQ